jgi:hypothetical protein
VEILKKEAKEKDEEHKKAVEILKKEAKEKDEEHKKEVKEKEEEHKKEVEILRKEAKEKEEEHKKEVEILKKEAKEREEMLKKEIKEIKEINGTNNKEIKKLKERMEKLFDIEAQYFKLKGRFIYKCFSDYIYLAFGINFTSKYEEKNTELKSKAIKLGIDYNEINAIIGYMQTLYKSQNKESHWNPSANEIKEYIISQFEEGNFDDEEIQKIKNFFKAISPEKEIINLFEFNNKLILIKTSVNEKMDKEKEKFNLISQINNSIGKVRREEILNTIKALFPNH